MTHEEFEKKVMDTLLSGEDEMLENFRKQYADSVAIERDFTGRGFFTRFTVPNELVYGGVNGRVDDVIARFDDNNKAYYFILYVKDGKIGCLEGFSTPDEWDYAYDEARVELCFNNRRDFDVH